MILLCHFLYVLFPKIDLFCRWETESTMQYQCSCTCPSKAKRSHLPNLHSASGTANTIYTSSHIIFWRGKRMSDLAPSHATLRFSLCFITTKQIIKYSCAQSNANSFCVISVECLIGLLLF